MCVCVRERECVCGWGGGGASAEESCSKHWTPKQHSKNTAQPQVDRYPASHFEPFNRCLSVLLIY